MAAPADQPLVFASMVEGLEARFGPQLAEPGLRRTLRELGVDLDRKAPAYPPQVWEQALETLAAALYPGLPPAEQLRRTGRDFLTGYFQTALGKAGLALARAIGVRRTLLRMGRNFRSGANYSTEEVVELGERELELRSRVEPRFVPNWPGKSQDLPYFTVGVLEALMDLLGAKNRRVELRQVSTLEKGMTVRLTWDA